MKIFDVNHSESKVVQNKYIVLIVPCQSSSLKTLRKIDGNSSIPHFAWLRNVKIASLLLAHCSSLCVNTTDYSYAPLV